MTVVGGHEWKGLSCVVNVITYFTSKSPFELFIHDSISSILNGNLHFKGEVHPK